MDRYTTTKILTHVTSDWRKVQQLLYETVKDFYSNTNLRHGKTLF